MTKLSQRDGGRRGRLQAKRALARRHCDACRGSRAQRMVGRKGSPRPHSWLAQRGFIRQGVTKKGLRHQGVTVIASATPQRPIHYPRIGGIRQAIQCSGGRNPRGGADDGRERTDERLFYWPTCVSRSMVAASDNAARPVAGRVDRTRPTRCAPAGWPSATAWRPPTTPVAATTRLPNLVVARWQRFRSGKSVVSPP